MNIIAFVFLTPPQKKNHEGPYETLNQISDIADDFFSHRVEGKGIWWALKKTEHKLIVNFVQCCVRNGWRYTWSFLYFCIILSQKPVIKRRKNNIDTEGNAICAFTKEISACEEKKRTYIEAYCNRIKKKFSPGIS